MGNPPRRLWARAPYGSCLTERASMHQDFHTPTHENQLLLFQLDLVCSYASKRLTLRGPADARRRPASLVHDDCSSLLDGLLITRTDLRKPGRSPGCGEGDEGKLDAIARPLCCPPDLFIKKMQRHAGRKITRPSTDGGPVDEGDYITPRRPARREARAARRPRRRIRRPMRRPCRRDCRRSMPTVCASAGLDATSAGAVTAIAAAANQPKSLRRETSSDIQTSHNVGAPR
jgi:hypothetical protein